MRAGVGKDLFDRRSEHPPYRRARRMALHHPTQVRIGWGLELALGNFLDAIDEAPTIGAIEEGLGVDRTKLEVGADVGFTHGSRLKRVEGRMDWR